MISLFSLLYRSPKWGQALLDSLYRCTPELKDGRAEFYWIACRANQETLSFIRRSGHRYARHEPAILDAMPQGYDGPEYLRAVYGGLNCGIRMAHDKCVVLSSDHVFTPGWLTSLDAAWKDSLALTSLTMEPGGGKHAVFPAEVNGTGALHRKLGRIPWEIDTELLDKVAVQESRAAYSPGGAHQPTLFLREAALDVGLYPEGNPNGDYGDRTFFRKLEAAGVKHQTWHGSVVYHIGEGEMTE